MPDFHSERCCADLGLSGCFRMPGPAEPDSAVTADMAQLPDNDPIERSLGIAWHEAAHAVAFTLLGIAVASVEIDPLQVCRPTLDGWPEEPSFGARVDAIATLAGPIGSAWLARCRFMPTREELRAFAEAVGRSAGGQCDRCQAARAARRWLGGQPSPEEITAALQRLHHEATELVTSRLGTLAIMDVAEGLMRAGRLDGEEVRRIVAHRKAQLGEET